MAPESTLTARGRETPLPPPTSAGREHGEGDGDSLRDSISHGDGDSLRDSDSHGDGDSLRDSDSHGDGDSHRDEDRAVAPVGTALLVAIAVVLAAGVGAATLGGAPLQEPAPTASLSLAVDGDELTVRHLVGDPLAVEGLRLRVTVDGDPLAHQPPVPFFSATGFLPGPTGAFNVAGDTTLSPGETATFRVASTNDPVPEAGDRVAVTVYSDGSRVARLTARVQ